MNQDMLCTWLGLPKSAWPPDPWTLLGLPRGEHDLATIEERVQDRMTTLRHYQLSYPDEATEGMNRLAEAFVALTETCRKPGGHDDHPTPATKKLPISKDDTSVINQTKVDWRAEPPPVRNDSTASAPEMIVEDEASAESVMVAKPFVAPAKPHRRQIDLALVRELAENSDEATTNVGTLDAVIERVEATRRLLYAWEKIGKQMKAVTKKVSPKLTEQFAKRFEEIAEVMTSYPAFLGHPGKPGYRVVVMARLKIPLATVRAMTPDQRDEVLFDWDVGYQVLLMHRKYLLKLFKSMRHRSTFWLIVHAMWAFWSDHPRLRLIFIVGLVLLVLMVGAWIALR